MEPTVLRCIALAANRLDLDTDDIDTLLQPFAADDAFLCAVEDWARGRTAEPRFTAGGFSVDRVMDDLGLPAFSALVLVGWIARAPDRVLPHMRDGYAVLRDSGHRLHAPDADAIAGRIASEAGLRLDTRALGYSVLAMVPTIQVAFWQWWQRAVVADVEVDGVTMRALVARPGASGTSHPVQALLALDWLVKQPERARPFLMSGP